MTIRDTSSQGLSLNRSPFAASRRRWAIVGDIDVKRPLRTRANSLGAVEIVDGANVGDRSNYAERIRILENENAHIAR